MSQRKEVIIVGAGASGLTAAIFTAEAGAFVTLLEQNEKPGRKIAVTGNGHCNLTNRKMDPGCYRGEHPEFAARILEQFSLEDTLRFFRRIGISVTDKKGWLYPRSGQAPCVTELLEQKARSLRVKIKTRESVTAVFPENDRWTVKTQTWSYQADAVILAGGSKASTVPGSDGSGYLLAKTLGHHITEPVPALVGLKCRGNFFKAWAGVRTEARLSLFIDGIKRAEESGELQLTDYGISGIPVFQLSRYAARALEEQKKVSVRISFLPEYDKKTLRVFLDELARNCPYLTRQDQLSALLPDKLIKILLRQPDLYDAILAFELEICGTGGFERAQVCAGGVDTLEINPETLESCLHPGLYFAGELLDIDGPCGGYNLQWAWCSGAVAGKHAAEKR